jgi:hypothetical protein
MRTTRTFVLMELTPGAYTEIRQRLIDAGYEHAIDDRTQRLDLHGIGVTPFPEPRIDTVKDGDVIIVKVGGVPYETVMVKGVQRFKRNALIDHLSKTGQLDLNQIAIQYNEGQYNEGKFDQRSYAEFNMALGYSVSGFADLSAFQDMEIENPLWKKEPA